VAAARNNYALAQRALEALIELEPNNAQAHAHLAHLRHLIGDTTGALEPLRRALFIEPNNAAFAAAQAIYAYATLDHLHEGIGLLNKAAGLDTDGSQMDAIVEALIHQQRFEDAEHFIGLFQERTGSLHPRMLRALGIALAGQDRQEDAREVFAAAIAACDAVLDDKPPAPDTWRTLDDAECRRQVELYAFRARLEHQAGQTAGAISTYEILHQVATARGMHFPEQPEIDTAARLADMRALVAGRDLILFGQGHSLAAFADRIDALGARKPAMASLNRFGVVEHDVLAPARRSLDIVVEISTPGVARNLKHLKPFLQQARPTMAIVAPSALDAAFSPDEREAFLAVNGRRLIVAEPNPVYSVTPFDPLGVIGDNALLGAIPLLVAAQPRRIFVIGADFAVPSDQRASHYGVGSKHFAARSSTDFVALGQDPQQRTNFDTAMRHDAAAVDRDLAFQIAAVSTLHGFDAPPVFNVSPDSRFDSMPKISLDAFFTMVE
jgi:tetratricopeptide (TPR) repeat protein